VERSGGGDESSPNLAVPPDVSSAMSAMAAPATAGVLDEVNDFDALFAAHYARLVRALTLIAGEPEVAGRLEVRVD
jgi:hypothetical protein